MLDGGLEGTHLLVVDPLQGVRGLPRLQQAVRLRRRFLHLEVTIILACCHLGGNLRLFHGDNFGYKSLSP